MDIFSRAWWDAAGARAANTAIAIAIPYVTLVLSGDKSPVYALNATAFAAVASLLTSMAGLAEVTGKVVPLWKAVLVRSTKTFGQSVAVWFGSSLIFNDLQIATFAVVVGGPVLITLLRTLKSYLPETAPITPSDMNQQVTR